MATAKQDVAAALTLAPGRDVKLLSALTWRRSGETAREVAVTIRSRGGLESSCQKMSQHS